MPESDPGNEGDPLDEDRLELLEGSDGIDAVEGEEAPGKEGEELDEDDELGIEGAEEGDEDGDELGIEGIDEDDDDGEELGIEGMPLLLLLCCDVSQAASTRHKAERPSTRTTRGDWPGECVFMVASVSFERARDPEVPPGTAIAGIGRLSSDFGRGRSTPVPKKAARVPVLLGPLPGST